MKAYMELVNNMLLTAEVQQTIVTPHAYISNYRQESFRTFPCIGNTSCSQIRLLTFEEKGGRNKFSVCYGLLAE